MTASVIGNLIIALLLIWVLWYIVLQFVSDPPWPKVAGVVAAVFSVIVIVMAIKGTNPVNVVYESLALLPLA